MSERIFTSVGSVFFVVRSVGYGNETISIRTPATLFRSPACEIVSFHASRVEATAAALVLLEDSGESTIDT